LQQGIESDHFHVNKNIPKVGRLLLIRHGEEKDRRFRGYVAAQEGFRLRRRIRQ
jgi:hypothetical protein